MSASKRLRQSIFTREKNLVASISTFVEPILIPTNSISQAPENPSNISNHQESSQADQFISLKKQIFPFEQKTEFHNEQSFVTLPKSTKTDTNKINQIPNTYEDDWVCPVAVALRRAGYNVPLRPSKSWLERDRKKQAALRERQPSFTEL